MATIDTIPEGVSLARLRRARALRRAGLVLVAGAVLAGAAGLFGVRTAVVRASAAGYDLEVTYPAVTRPGLASPWAATIHREGGFPGDVTLAIPLPYLNLFDFNAVYPAPADERAVGDEVRWTFAAPEGDTLRVLLDARLSPAVQWGMEASTRLLVGGREVVTVRYPTRVMP